MPTSVNFDGPVDLGASVSAIPTGGLTMVVMAGGAVQSGLPAGLANPSGGFFTTVAAAAAATRANRGDIIYALPGHTENIAAADGWPTAAGVKIIGLGWGTMRPTITLTAAASNMTMNDANVVIDNFRFIHSTTNVTQGFTVTAAGVQFKNCYVQASDASNKITSVFLLNAADDFLMDNCEIQGGATALTDTFLLATGASARVRILNTRMAAALATTQGLITASVAPTRLVIDNCNLENTTAVSTVALKTVASSTGFVRNTTLGIAQTDAGGIGAAAWNTKGNLTGYNVLAATITLGGVTAITATQ